MVQRGPKKGGSVHITTPVYEERTSHFGGESQPGWFYSEGHYKVFMVYYLH